MKIQYVFIFLLSLSFILQNCNCGQGNTGDTGGLHSDSLRIADSLRQVYTKDSIYNDSILKAQNIKVKSNELEPVVKEKVDKIIEAKTEASP
ncbi:MAG: hypothetical protein IPN97_09810 [Saprospiraceae bacterium]|nr:hypothetical protein [Saprospiraceae bacterium]